MLFTSIKKGDNEGKSRHQQMTARSRSLPYAFLNGLKIFFIVLMIARPAVLKAQSFEDGYKKYSVGDMEGAISSLKSALGKNPPPPEKIKIYKLLGIVQFMKGQEQEAASSFQKLISLDPKASISSKDVFDESVIKFFNKVKKSPSPSPSPSRQTAGAKAARGKSKLMIQSNAREAEVFVDGILVGNVGKDIEVPPGTTSVTLKAKGFQTKTFKLKIRERAENNFTLKLAQEKIQKAQPRVAKKAEPKKDGKYASEAKGRGKKPKGEGPDMFADDEPVYTDDVLNMKASALKASSSKKGGKGSVSNLSKFEHAPPIPQYRSAQPNMPANFVSEPPVPQYQPRAPAIAPQPVYPMPQPAPMYQPQPAPVYQQPGYYTPQPAYTPQPVYTPQPAYTPAQPIQTYQQQPYYGSSTQRPTAEEPPYTDPDVLYSK
ncbi:MAG: PEGA domain-containing protein [Oligoflexales bacterium]|nr:PEGA domain-containing protein [Oligoflexales bacterium]